MIAPSVTRTPKLPPGPRYPRALSTLGWITRPMPFMERCQQRYGDIFTLRVAHEGTWVFLAHPDMVKQVFTGDATRLHAGEANAILEPVVGRHSVLLLDEAPHMAQRKLMLPSFHGERMQRYGDLMRAIAQEELERWPVGKPVALWPRMQAITLEVIMRAVFGISDADRLGRLRQLLADMLNLTTAPWEMLKLVALGPKRIQANRGFRATVDPVDDLVRDEIRARRAVDDLSERDDVLSLLLQARHEDGSQMSDQELRDELMTLLVAGHETTATSMAWALERLMRHPDKLERLAGELADGSEEYLDAVIKETLRLRPVLPIVVRRLTEPLELGGHLLPAGVSVAPCIHLIHRRPDIYPEPRRFEPERFLEQPPGTYTWIPFGGGVRRCLGASFALYEMKVVLGEIIGRLRLAPARERAERVARRAITLTPEHGTEAVVVGRRDRVLGAPKAVGAAA
ncbi:MAG TPA: cytochrome P450 [Solirubrobacteraceae bacterium]|jgi:cytochrome P450|nr:cytochrome P450 [Solirubrobacteraceae bacterium]